MSATSANTRLAWEDHWVKPNFKTLMSVYDPAGKKKVLDQLIKNFTEFEGIRREIIWYGAAWKWAEQYTLVNEKGNDVEVMAYFVPNPETPVICVPLRDEIIASLPIKRLNKFIREGIRSATNKCAVEVHWAMWSPSASTEVEHLTDLYKRKYKFLTGTK
ncbi:hypothetical protein [Poriferisphaera sp. WC338]|uniref:hypothetical protein n=1 Tax=Poriferisphaera sp. WC338 TaxID=3425129 RepID=UPI003D8185FA